MSSLPRPTYYCARCREIKPVAPSNDALCPTCPEEPLVDVSDPDQRRSLEDLEADALDRHTYKWVAGIGIVLGLGGVFLGWIVAALTDVQVLFYSVAGIGIVSGVFVGRQIGARTWTRGGRPKGLEEALERARLSS